MKDDESRMEEELDDIEEPDEVYSNMLRKVKNDEGEEERPDNSDDVQEKISDKVFYDDASYSHPRLQIGRVRLIHNMISWYSCPIK